MTMTSFIDLLAARSELMAAYLSNPTTSTTYKVTKYVKIPMMSDGNKVIVPLRPNDVVETRTIVREGKTVVTKMRFVCSHNMDIMDDKMTPVWNEDKIGRWVEANLTRLEPVNEEDTDRPMQAQDDGG